MAHNATLANNVPRAALLHLLMQFVEACAKGLLLHHIDTYPVKIGEYFTQM